MEWLHLKAGAERWDEEVRLLRAESERIGRSFLYLKSECKNRGAALSMRDTGGSQGTSVKGAIAFAARQVSTFERLQRKAEKSFTQIIKFQ